MLLLWLSTLRFTFLSGAAKTIPARVVRWLNRPWPVWSEEVCTADETCAVTDDQVRTGSAKVALEHRRPVGLQ